MARGASDVEIALGLLIQLSDPGVQAGLQKIAQSMKQVERSAGAMSATSAAGARAAAAAIREWERGLQRLQRGFNRLQTSLTRAGTWLMGWAARITAVLGGIGTAAVGWGLQLTSQMNMASISIRQFVGDASRANQIIKDIRKTADWTPFRFPDLAASGRFMSAFRLRGQGGEAQWALRAGALAAGGLGSFSGPDIMQASRAIGYMKTNRRGEAMEALARMGITPQILAEYGANFTMGGSGIKWQSSNDEIIQSLAKAIDSIYVPMLAEQSRELPGRASTVADKLQGMASELTAKLYTSLADGLGRIYDYLDRLNQSPAWQKLIGWFDKLWTRLGVWADAKVTAAFDYISSGRAEAALGRIATVYREQFAPAIGSILETLRSTDWQKGAKTVLEILRMLAEGIAMLGQHPTAAKMLAGGWAINALGIPNMVMGGVGMARGAWGMLAGRGAAAAAGGGVAAAEAAAAGGAGGSLWANIGASAANARSWLTGPMGRTVGGRSFGVRNPFYRRFARVASPGLGHDVQEWLYYNPRANVARGSGIVDYLMAQGDDMAPRWRWTRDFKRPWYARMRGVNGYVPQFRLPTVGQVGGAALGAYGTWSALSAMQEKIANTRDLDALNPSWDAWKMGWGGALMGAATGSTLGPAGTVVGALAGGTIGSVKSAAAYRAIAERSVGRTQASQADYAVAREKLAALSGMMQGTRNAYGQVINLGKADQGLAYINQLMADESLSDGAKSAIASRLQGRGYASVWEVLGFRDRQAQAAMPTAPAEQASTRPRWASRGATVSTTPTAAGYGQAMNANFTFYVNSPDEVAGIVREQMEQVMDL